QTEPKNVTSKNFTIDPQSRYKTLNILTRDTLKEMKEQVRHLIIDKPDIDMKTFRISNEAKRARRATVGIDPNDILKAKNLAVDTSKLDEFVHQNHHLIEYPSNHHYSVPSSNAFINNNRKHHCDNNNQSINVRSGSRSPIDVVEFLPRNHTTTTTTTNIVENSSRFKHLDVQPRNDRLLSSMAKKNHHARNHFFHEDNEQKHLNNIMASNCSSSSSTTTTTSHIESQMNNRSQKQCDNNHDESSGVGYDKENCPIPNFKQMFLLNDYGDDDGDDNYTKSKSSLKNRSNTPKMFGKVIDTRHSIHDFEKSLSRKPVKKSSDIMEKAQFLEQKFDEHNRSYVPNLNRVGRIEEDDWNVKIWNDTNLFAPKVDKSGRPFVGENSRNLLQSRITQLNNNFEYNRPMAPKTFLSTTTTATNNVKNNDYVNMLSNEVCQKLNPSTCSSNVVPESQRPIEDVTDSVKITSAFRDNNPYVRRRMPGSDLLKPIGDCRRCTKTLLANDRVTILGRNFHRYYLIYMF
ncbi:hypothetical protein BLA29_004173, partial [Euroglyphus maynei]